ncbi:MAG: hypothetical protein N2450_08635 [bacterium]|nr:hypothetical protein [bacterium]
MNSDSQGTKISIDELRSLDETQKMSDEEIELQENIFAGIVQVNLPVYKGPLDVLCLLLRRGEIDAKKISSVEVARQVNEIIPHLAGQDIFGAGQTLYYDALLLQVKSALLSQYHLPEIQLTPPETNEVDTSSSDLSLAVTFLFQTYQQWYGMFPRGSASGDLYRPLGKVDLSTRKKLLYCYWELLNRPQPTTTILKTDITPITLRRQELIRKLPLRQKVSLQSLWKNETTLEKVLTFLTLLDLSFQQVVLLSQMDDEKDLWIERIKTPITLAESNSGEGTDQLSLAISN